MMPPAMNARGGGLARRWLVALAIAFSVLLPPVAHAADSAQPSSDPGNGVSVLEQFDRQQAQRVNQASELSDHGKHVIMFLLAVPLFILLLATGGLGIATGVYGKQLFIPHMICAGLTITLAIAHVIAGIVWFYPF